MYTTEEIKPKLYLEYMNGIQTVTIAQYGWQKADPGANLPTPHFWFCCLQAVKLGPYAFLPYISFIVSSLNDSNSCHSIPKLE